MSSLIKLDEAEVTSSQSSVTLTGFTDTYSTYVIYLEHIVPDTDAVNIQIQLTASGVAQGTSNYDRAYLAIYANGTASSVSQSTNAGFSILNAGDNIGSATDEGFSGVVHIFSARSSAEYTSGTIESAFGSDSQGVMGSLGGFLYTVAEVHDGVKFTFSSSANIESGKFSLYGIKS